MKIYNVEFFIAGLENSIKISDSDIDIDEIFQIIQNSNKISKIVGDNYSLILNNSDIKAIKIDWEESPDNDDIDENDKDNETNEVIFVPKSEIDEDEEVIRA